MFEEFTINCIDEKFYNEKEFIKINQKDTTVSRV